MLTVREVKGRRGDSIKVLAGEGGRGSFTPTQSALSHPPQGDFPPPEVSGPVVGPGRHASPSDMLEAKRSRTCQRLWCFLQSLRKTSKRLHMVSREAGQEEETLTLRLA